MSDQLLFLLKLCLLALLYLFFFRVLRAVWAELRAPAPVELEAAQQGAAQRGAASAARMPPVPAPPAPIPPAQPLASKHKLVVVEPAERAGQSFAMGPEITVGRAPGCQISVPDDSFVSQVHARVFARDGSWFVEDMGSTNGTFHDDRKIGGPTEIRQGDRIRVGGTVLEMR